SQPDCVSRRRQQGKAQAQGQVREERVGAHQRRSLRQLYRRGGRGQRRPRDAESDGHHLWALHSGGVGIRAGRKGHYVSQIAASRASALRRKWIRRNSYGKEDYGFGEVADCSGQGHSGPSGGSGAGPSADQHHGVLQAVQCQDQRQGTRRPDHPGGGVGVQRSHLYLHHQNASGFHSVEAGRGRGQGFWYAEQGQGRQGEREAGPGNCQAEDARSERGFGRSGSQEREGYGALHGYRSYSLRLSHNVGVLAAQTAVVDTTAFRQQGTAVEDKESNEEIRKEYRKGARRRRSSFVYAAGRSAPFAESEVRQVRRDRGLDDAPGSRSQARRPDGPRHRGAAAWAGQNQEGAGHRQRRKSARG